MRTGLLNSMTPQTVLDELRGHVGAANGITARDLVFVLTGEHSACGERTLRNIVEALRSQGSPVCASPAFGYFVAANDEEMDATCEFLLSRAMTSLKQIAAMKKVALPDLRGQLRLANDKGELL